MKKGYQTIMRRQGLIYPKRIFSDSGLAAPKAFRLYLETAFIAFRVRAKREAANKRFNVESKRYRWSRPIQSEFSPVAEGGANVLAGGAKPGAFRNRQPRFRRFLWVELRDCLRRMAMIRC